MAKRTHNAQPIHNAKPAHNEEDERIDRLLATSPPEKGQPRRQTAVQQAVPIGAATDDDPRVWLAGIEARKLSMTLLIEPPLPLAALSAINEATAKDLLPVIEEWLKATAAAGGTADLRRAWGAWRPIVGVGWKTGETFNLYGALTVQTMRKDSAAGQRAQVLNNAESARANQALKIDRARSEVEEAEKTLSEKRAELARLEAAA